MSPKNTLLLLAVTAAAAPLAAQTVTVPLTAAEWQATDSIRFENYLGRPAVYINSGVAMSRSAHFRNGTLEFDIAAPPQSTNLGIAIRAQRTDMSEVIFFRPGSSGTDDAMQYAPAVNSIPAMWQIYHGPGANSAVNFPREQWIHVRMRVAGDTCAVYLNNGAKPVLVVPHLYLGGTGDGLMLWGSGFGRGAYFANIRYTPDNAQYATSEPPMPKGTIMRWLLSPVYDAADITPGTLPDLNRVVWDTARAESPGLVLINRYRRSPGVLPPEDGDSILHGRVPGSKVVFARTHIESDRDHYVLLHFGYSDNIVVYCNGQPLFSGVNPSSFRNLGYFEPFGDAVFLPLKAGSNEITFAVTEFFGGWAFSGVLDDRK